MRIVLVLVLAIAALAQAAADWQATIGEGYAYRLTSVGSAAQRAWPDGYGRTVAWLRDAAPWALDPVGTTLMALPLALVLAAIAALLWSTRPRRR